MVVAEASVEVDPLYSNLLSQLDRGLDRPRHRGSECKGGAKATLHQTNGNTLCTALHVGLGFPHRLSGRCQRVCEGHWLGSIFDLFHGSAG